jgi:aminopeptidase N
MRRAALLLSLATACQSSTPGSTLPPASMDLTRDITSTGLAIDLKNETGVATIGVAPSATSTGLSFETGDLTIDSVTIGGETANIVSSAGRLDVGLPANSAGPVVIAYKFTDHNAFNGWMPSMGVTFTWPYYCGNLFPCHSAPADGTTFTLALTDLPAGATAVFPDAIPDDAPSYQLAWAVGSYTYFDLGTTTAGTDVGVYYLAGHQAAAITGTSHLKQVFDWYEQNLGPYRFGAKVATVEAAWGPGAYGGMEHHPYWHVGSDSLSDEETNAHEPAHGWFGDGIRIACWEDFVLSEGTVSYLAAKSLGATAGQAAEDTVWTDYQSRLDYAEANESLKTARPAGCGQIDVLKDGLFTDIPYMKGAFFLRAVEMKVGAAQTLQALSDFYMAHAGGAAGMSDLVATIQTSTGYDATACEQAWLESDAVPTSASCP